jgi:hypothetical protein
MNEFERFLRERDRNQAELYEPQRRDILPKLSMEQLLCVAMARLYEGMGLDDDALIEELYRRGNGTRVK